MKLPALLFFIGFMAVALSTSAQQRFNFNIPECNPDEETSVHEVSEDQNRMQLYPNPVEDYLQINFFKKEKNEKAALKIFNLNGKEVLVKSVNTGENIRENVSGLPPGVYLLEVKCNSFLERTQFVQL